MVQLKKKVTLRTKKSDKPTNETTVGLSENSTEIKSGKNSMVWVLGSLFLIIIVSAFFIFRPDTNKVESSDNIIVSEQIAENIPVESEPSAISGESQTLDIENSEVNDKATVVDNTTPSRAPGSESLKNANSELNTSLHKNDDQKKISGSIEDKALLVIRGDFGNGEERKLQLGSEYEVIQSKVNEMYKAGSVI